MTTAAVERLAARLVGLEKQVRGLSAPSLGYSTIEGGEIGVVDDEGNPIGTIGPLPDGSGGGFNPINGQRPPTPTAPILTKVPGGLKVTWDGLFEGGAIVPLNFSRVEVHVGDAAGFYDGSAIWMRGTIESPRGGDVVVMPLAKEPKYAVLVARSQSGLASFASVEVSATPGGFFTDEDQAFIDSELAANAEALAANEVAITKLNTDLAANTATQTQLKADLDANEVAVANAKAQADAAVAKATAAQTTADGKGKVHYTTAPPTASSTFDVWFDTDNDNLPHRWDGSTWVAQPLGNAAIGNLTAAKITTGEMSGARISAGTLDAGKITTGTLDANRVAVVNLNAGNITSGTINAAVIGVINLSASNITSGQINAANIAVVNINASNITAGTMHTDRLTGKTITSDRIFSNTITSASGVIANLWADHITAGSLSADRLDANSLWGRTITGGLFRTGTSGNRITMTGGAANRIEWTASDRNGHIRLDGSGVQYDLTIAGPWDNIGGEWIRLRSYPAEIVMGVYGNWGGGGDILKLWADSSAQYIEALSARIVMNNNPIYIRGYSDANHLIRHESTYDGPAIHGYSGVALWTMYNSRNSVTAYANSSGEFRVATRVYANGIQLSSLTENKRSIKAAPDGLETLKKLRPVAYERTKDAHGNAIEKAALRTKERGLLAEDVAAAFPAGAAYDPETGALYGVDLMALVTLLISSVQELEQRLPAAAGRA